MTNKTVKPGGAYYLKLNAIQCKSKNIAMIPQFSRLENPGSEWQPQVCAVEDGHAVYQNRSGTFLSHPKGVHFNMAPVSEVSRRQALARPRQLPQQESMNLSAPTNIHDGLSDIKINKDILSARQLDRLDGIHALNIDVFDDNLNVGFEGYEARLNFKVEQQAPPFKLWVPQYNKKCQDLLQSKCDQLERQGVLADPIRNNINVRNVSPCFIQQKARAKHKKLEDCALEEIRFITDFNVLNNSMRAIPNRSNSYEDITKFLARHKFFIFADLFNSYFQVKIHSEDWKHLAILTPHRGLKVMTRLGQGLLNSDVVLDQVLAQTLGDEISAGFCLAARDDLFVAGDSLDETISRWEIVLGKLAASNLKITSRKVRIFLEDSEVFGHKISNGTITPSEHTITSLGEMKTEDIKTNKQMNSYKGLYKTLSRHLPDMASMMAPFDKATAGKLSSGKFDWDEPGNVSAFNRAQKQLEKINKTYLPRPEEKLYLMPDTASEDICTGWALYTERKTPSGTQRLPVQYCSAKLQGYMGNWFPCEQEGVGAVLAIEQCRHWINESHHPTSILCDNQPVVDAANLLKLGRHSKSPRLQSLLTSVNRSNIEFYHNSAKRGHHVVPDTLSRMKRTCGAKDCQVERFLDDIPSRIQCMSSTILANPTLLDIIYGYIQPANLGATTAQLSDLLCKGRPIPLGSRSSWMEIQRSDEQCRRFLDQVKYGQLPHKKDRARTNLNRMWKECCVENDLIVCKSFDEILQKERSRVFVPAQFLNSILTVMHVRLDHVTSYQLEKVFNRYFFGINTKGLCDSITDECGTCIGFKKFPKELDEFKTELEPEHPGTHMNSDVMARAGQKILITVDMFSGYVNACVINSEKRDDIADGIVQTVTAIRNSQTVQVRSDKAPSLKSLVKTEHRALGDNGITIALGDDINKNSNCVVDKKIQELESELKRFCPQETKISLGTLSRAVTNLNSRVRNQGLSASQIHFSRDLVTGENLHLDDKVLRDDKQEKRQANQISSAKSKTPKGKLLTKPEVEPGNIVYVKSDGSKHECRDPYMVMGRSGSKVATRKMLHTSLNAERSPTLSNQVYNIDQKFLFQISESRVTPSVKKTPEPPYIIPQRRPSAAPVHSWVSTQTFGYDSEAAGDEQEGIEEKEEEDINSVEEEEEPREGDDSFLVGEILATFEQEEAGTDQDRQEMGDGDIQPAQIDVTANDDGGADTESANSESDKDDSYEDYLLHQPKIKRGTFILMFCKMRDRWIKIKTTSKYNSTPQVERELGEYWNYRSEDGTEDGAYFKVGQYWGVLSQEDLQMDPSRYVITLPCSGIPQHDGPIATPASMSPATSANNSDATSADNSMCSNVGAATSTPIPMLDNAFAFQLPLLGEVVFKRNEQELPGEAVAPMDHMRFLRRVYFPTQAESDGPVVSYHKIHYGDEQEEIAELDTAVCDVTGEITNADDHAAPGSRNSFFSRLNPFKKR